MINKEQEKLVYNGIIDHAVIRGIAGSGKTLVGVAKMICLLERNTEGDGNSILFLMDVAQSIYTRAWLVKNRTFKTIGYDMKGRGYKLNKNYRTTTEISTCAYSLLEKEQDIINNEDYITPSLIERHGEYPVYKNFSTYNEQSIYVGKLIKALVARGYKNSDIAVVSRLHQKLNQLSEDFNQRGIAHSLFNGREDVFQDNKVKLLTMHAAKGLEFKIVILVDLNNDTILLITQEIDQEDIKYREIIEEIISSLHYCMNVGEAEYGVATNGKNIAFYNKELKRINDIPFYTACQATDLHK